MISLEALCNDPLAVTGKPVVKVLHRQQVVFYLLSPTHYHGLLHPVGNPDAPMTSPPVITVPPGKFAMYAEWTPGTEFEQQAALWGICIEPRLTDAELAAFVSYWQAEGKMFHHIQWLQKLARSVQVSRARPAPASRRDINQVSAPDDTVPDGFRG